MCAQLCACELVDIIAVIYILLSFLLLVTSFQHYFNPNSDFAYLLIEMNFRK